MEEKSNNILMLVFSTLLGAAGQFFFKYAFGKPTFAVFLGTGIAAYLLSTVIYFYVLSRVHLSFAYSMGGLSYIFAVILAALFLKETVPLLRWVGVITIAIGVVLIGLS